MSGELPLPKLGSHWTEQEQSCPDKEVSGDSLTYTEKKFVGIKVVSVVATHMKSQQYGCLYETRTMKTTDVPRWMGGSKAIPLSEEIATGN